MRRYSIRREVGYMTQRFASTKISPISRTYLPGRYDVYKYSAAGVNLINARAEALPADSG